MNATWFGDVPEGWCAVPLYGIASERKTPNKGLRETNLLSLSYGRIIRKDIETNQGLLPASFETYQIVDPDNIVLRMTDLQNDQRSLRSALVGETGIITSAYLALALRHVDPRFMAYQFRAIDLMKVFYSMGGGLRQSIGFDDLKRLPVLSPPLEEQRAIADYLDRETAQIDAFIAKNEELITLLTERRRAAIEMEVAPTEAPAGWDFCQIRRLGPRGESGVSVNGYALPAEGGEVGVLKTGAVSKGLFDPSENKRVVEEDLARVAAPVRRNTLIVNRANTPDLVGGAGYVEADHPNLFLSDKLWQLTFKAAEAAYVHYWTQSDAYRSQLRGLSVGASSSMQNLSYGDFLSVTISVPPIREQVAIVARLDRVVAGIADATETARRSIELARERRAALISAAVTGKIDVGVGA